MRLKKVIIYSLIVIYLVSCNKAKEDKNIDTNDSIMIKTNTINTLNEEADILSSDKTDISDFTNFQELFENLPMPTSLIAKFGEKSYLGTFYIGKDGIEEAVFESSGYEIIIDSVDITEKLFTVNFSLLDTGNEVKEATGEVFSYTLRVTLSDLLNAYKNSENRLRMEIQGKKVGAKP